MPSLEESEKAFLAFREAVVLAANVPVAILLSLVYNMQYFIT